MSEDDLIVLRRVRATRHNPPDLAAKDPSRMRRYGAALEQFEELLGAARVVGSASRPLPLFYALAQAGCAIAAAHLTRDRGVLKGFHGLKLVRPASSFLSVAVKPEQRGAFQDVAEAVGSPPLTDPIELAALWASLPEASGDPLPGSQHPSAIAVWPEDQPTHGLTLLTITSKAVARVVGLPAAFGNSPDQLVFLQEYLQHYPSAEGWEAPPDGGLAPSHDPESGWSVRLQWQLPAATGSASDRFEYLLTKVAPRYRTDQPGWLRPALGLRADRPHPITTWWALLYGLSMLARYHPEEWVDMLAVDRSPVATTLEAMLDDALAAVPRLVLGALWGRPFIEGR